MQRGVLKSKLEKTVFATLKPKVPRVEYEPDSFEFIQPAKRRKYTPDFKIRKNTYIEVKGRLTIEDREKLVWFKEQRPEITVYLLFSTGNNKLRKGSPTTYGEWATKNGYQWSDMKRGIPDEWLDG